MDAGRGRQGERGHQHGHGQSVRDDYDPEIHVVRSELRNGSGPGRLGPRHRDPVNLPTGRGGPGPSRTASGKSNVIRNYEIARNQTERIVCRATSPGSPCPWSWTEPTERRSGARVFVPDRGRLNTSRGGTAAVGFNADREHDLGLLHALQPGAPISWPGRAGQRQELCLAHQARRVPGHCPLGADLHRQAVGGGSGPCGCWARPWTGPGPRGGGT